MIEKVLVQQEVTARDVNNALVAGFEMATRNGPLCEEPMLGACFIVESVQEVLAEEVI